jgi:hypothetical protein
MRTPQLESYENFVASIPYAYSFNFDHEVENRATLPPFIDVFQPYYYLDKFIEEYFLANKNNETIKQLVAAGKKPHIEGKATRAYSSLVREHHLYLLLEDKYKTVIRNRTVDYIWGIDVIVLKGPFAYAVHAYTDTKRSRMFHELKKNDRHKEYTCGILVELPLVLVTAPKLGDIFTYGPKDIAKLDKVIHDTEEEYSRSHAIVRAIG